MGARRRYRADNDGVQPGDPAKAVAVILAAVDADDPPLHLPLGPRAHELARTKFAAFLGAMDAWTPMSLRTSFDADDHPGTTTDRVDGLGRPVDQTAVLVRHAAEVHRRGAPAAPGR